MHKQARCITTQESHQIPYENILYCKTWPAFLQGTLIQKEKHEREMNLERVFGQNGKRK